MARMPELALEDMDDAALKARSGHYKFMQQIFLGIGGATLFGLVGAVATAALHPAGMAAVTGALATSWPILLGFAVVGVASLMMGSHFWTEAIDIDQQSQARKIGKATRGPAQETNITPEQAPQQTMPGLGMDTVQADAAPSKQWAAQFADRSGTASFTEKAQTSKAVDAAPTISV